MTDKHHLIGIAVSTLLGSQLAAANQRAAEMRDLSRDIEAGPSTTTVVSALR